MVAHEFMFRLTKNGKRIHLARGWGGHVESSRFDSQLGMEKIFPIQKRMILNG